MAGGRSIRVVVVDVDDTLILTEASTFALENEVLRRMGRAPMPRAVHRSTWGRPLLEAIVERSPGVDVAAFDALLPAVMAEYVAAGSVDVVPEENIDALDALVRVGLRVMMLTSRTGLETAHLLTADHVLSTRISAAYHAGNMRFAKPSPRAFDELLSDHDLTPDECVYVGDSPTDAAAANGAGLYFVATLEGGLRTRDDFAAYRVDAFVDSFPEIVGAVGRLCEQVDGAPRAAGGRAD